MRLENDLRERVDRLVVGEAFGVVDLREPLDRGSQQQHHADALAHHDVRHVALAADQFEREADRLADTGNNVVRKFLPPN